MYLYFGHIMIEATLSDLTNETLRLICLSTLCVDFRYLWRLLFCYLHALRQPELQPRGGDLRGTIDGDGDGDGDE